MTEIKVERTWLVNGLMICKSCEVSCLTGKKIPNSTIYSVDEIDGDNLNCFKTFAEAKRYAKEF